MSLHDINPEHIWDQLATILGTHAKQVPPHAVIAGGAVANLILRDYTPKQGPIRDVDVFIPKPPEAENVALQLGAYYHTVVSVETQGPLQILGIVGAGDYVSTDQLLAGFDLNCCQASLQYSAACPSRGNEGSDLLSFETRKTVEVTKDFAIFCEDKLLKIMTGNTPLRTLARFWKKVEDLGLDQTNEQQQNNHQEMVLLNHILRSHIMLEPQIAELGGSTQEENTKEELLRFAPRFTQYFTINQLEGKFSITPLPQQVNLLANSTNIEPHTIRAALAGEPNALGSNPDFIKEIKKTPLGSDLEILANYGHPISQELWDRCVKSIGTQRVWQIILENTETAQPNIPKKELENLPLDIKVEDMPVLQYLLSTYRLSYLNGHARLKLTWDTPIGNRTIREHLRNWEEQLGTKRQKPESVFAPLKLEELNDDVAICRLYLDILSPPLPIPTKHLTPEVLKDAGIRDRIIGNTTSQRPNNLFSLPPETVAARYHDLKRAVTQAHNEYEEEAKRASTRKAQLENKLAILEKWLLQAAKIKIAQSAKLSPLAKLAEKIGLR